MRKKVVNTRLTTSVFAIVLMVLGAGALPLLAQESANVTTTTHEPASDSGAAATATGTAEPAADKSAKPPAPPKLPEPKGARRLSPQYDVWVDPKQKAVIVDGLISLREGMLEMFACTRNTKEHESIVSANTKAYLVHAALLSVGAEPGRPVQWVPKYRPPTGAEIEITVHWRDPAGKEHRARAQDWVKDIRTGKAMTHPWVFAGSRFWTDEETGKKYYQAEAGDFICVSNFGTAMLDIPIESSQSNQDRAFEAYTDRIPPLGAPVRLVLKPNIKKQGGGSSEQEVRSKKPGEVSRESRAKANGQVDSKTSGAEE
jgi:hypothetical protein